MTYRTNSYDDLFAEHSSALTALGERDKRIAELETKLRLEEESFLLETAAHTETANKLDEWRTWALERADIEDGEVPQPSDVDKRIAELERALRPFANNIQSNGYPWCRDLAMRQDYEGALFALQNSPNPTEGYAVSTKGNPAGQESETAPDFNPPRSSQLGDGVHSPPTLLNVLGWEFKIDSLLGMYAEHPAKRGNAWCDPGRITVVGEPCPPAVAYVLENAELARQLQKPVTLPGLLQEFMRATSKAPKDSPTPPHPHPQPTAGSLPNLSARLLALWRWWGMGS